MKTFAQFNEAPITQIEPAGWVRQYLEKQAKGLTGNMEAAGYPFNRNPWGIKRRVKGSGWWPYEQTAYWIDGAIRCAHLLRDPKLTKKAAQQIDFAVKNIARDGFVGPDFLRIPNKGNQWPHSIFFRALAAHYYATGDERIVKAMQRHYLSKTSSYERGREICNIESILWTYGQTGDRELLRLATRAYDNANKKQKRKNQVLVEGMLSPMRPSTHGVSYNEISKIAAIVYCYTGKRKYLNATINAYKKIDKHAMLVDGIHSSSEFIRGKDPLDSHETCDIADYMWSVGHLLMITGNAEYGDKLERAAFNAGPGASKSDAKGLQYFSCPNQIACTKGSNHNIFKRGEKWMSFRPNPGTECCPGEWNRVMPNYAARMWMRDAKGAIVAALYGPSRFVADINGQEVTIVEETRYPFEERIEFQMRLDKPVRFALKLRIPKWCKKARIAIDGVLLKQKLRPGTFATINRLFQPNTRISLQLPMDIAVSRWPRNGVAVERGPLVYSLRIDEKWTRDKTEKRQTNEFPACDVRPASDWNYALCLDSKGLPRNVEVVQKPTARDPWSLATAPIELKVRARKVRGWRMIRTKKTKQEIWWGHDPKGTGTVFKIVPVKGNFEFTPQIPEGSKLTRNLSAKRETVTLVPYGCTHLRITVFPRTN